MKSWFFKRGYPENMIDEEINKVKFSEKGSKKSKGGLKGFHLSFHITPL